VTNQEPDADAEHPDYTLEDGLLVFTAAYHLKRGSCCGSGCRHCPFEPRHVEGTTKVNPTMVNPTIRGATGDRG